MCKYLEKNYMQIYFALLLITLNVLLQIGRCCPGGTCNPGWEPLLYSDERMTCLRACGCRVINEFFEKTIQN